MESPASTFPRLLQFGAAIRRFHFDSRTVLTLHLFLLACLLTPAQGSGITIRFCGAIGNIFGSCHLVDTGSARILLDCGSYMNREQEVPPGVNSTSIDRDDELGFDPATIDAVIVSHAHLDHMGRIPYLFRKGFRGSVYGTEATCELTPIMLDVGSFLEEQTENPLYGPTDVKKTVRALKPVRLMTFFKAARGIDCRFLNAGHILGSSMTELVVTLGGGIKRTLVFTGDLGNSLSTLTSNPAAVLRADVLIVESTYGNRLHGPIEGDLRAMTEAIGNSIGSGGHVLIPSYVMSRTQKVIYFLGALKREGRIDPAVPVVVDSRMASRITGIYRKYDGFKPGSKTGDPFEFPGLVEVKRKYEANKPSIIIAPSGMCDVGRIRDHMARFLSDPRSTIIFVGFQAPGTLGQQVLSGVPTVDIDGREVENKAKSLYVSSFSGHADANQIISWMKGFKSLGKVFVVHGFSDSSRDLAARIRSEIGFEAVVPEKFKDYPVD